MEDKLGDSGVEPYGLTYMKQELIAHFQGRLHVSETNGVKCVVTLKSNVAHILSDFHSSLKARDPDEEKSEVLKAAARLIKHDILECEKSKADYPSIEMLTMPNALEFLPEFLRIFLNNVFRGNKESQCKVASIGQSIMQTARPRAILSPVLLGL